MPNGTIDSVYMENNQIEKIDPKIFEVFSFYQIKLRGNLCIDEGFLIEYNNQTLQNNLFKFKTCFDNFAAAN
jgi:hypothetical protein